MPSKYAVVLAASTVLLACAQGGTGQRAKETCAFPAGLRQEITKKFPGARVVTSADLTSSSRRLFEKDHGDRCPGLIQVDFYGDGKPTWAFVLIKGEGAKRMTELVVARQTNRAWEVLSLDTADAAPVPVVWREEPGQYHDVHGEKTLHAVAPPIVFCGYETWAILYSWNGKSVEKVWISD